MGQKAWQSKVVEGWTGIQAIQLRFSGKWEMGGYGKEAGEGKIIIKGQTGAGTQKKRRDIIGTGC